MAAAPHHRPLIVFAGGGTGGHLYPALAIAAALRRLDGTCRIVFFGTNRPIDTQIISQTEWELFPQRLARMSVAPWRWPAMATDYRRAAIECRRRFLQNRPDWVIGTGGLGSVPPVRQAAKLSIPTALLNPDALAGRANRHLARMAKRIYVQWPQARDAFPNAADVRVTGCPIRRALGTSTRADGLRRFGLDGRKKTLLITGASQGARTINQAMVLLAGFLKEQDEWQVLHLSGRTDYESVSAGYAHAGYGAVVVAFTDHMADALACADLVVSRGGASTLSEITASALPSIILPYPFHRDMHQLANARCLSQTEHGPAATILIDKIKARDNAPRLQIALQETMADGGMRASMARAAARLATPDSADRIAAELLADPRLDRPAQACELLQTAPLMAR